MIFIRESLIFIHQYFAFLPQIHLLDLLNFSQGTMNAIVRRTAKAASNRFSSSSSSLEKAKIVSSREMQLIKSRDDILNPPLKFRALRVPCLTK